ncbi:HAMP domain-containing sensor histidine kinase [Cronbergia sp. UHCC 0137]|uniref:sensor histidine kinase n=1 Tax=Cronbergia sp. UHCC 0137 TaxID=3110239 RepID=UPI002B1F1E0F|nr:HAMP domain-containing sensor histidine kinase [Cronbergia sp. UHCC 0137]MEA5621006.1 HAMP domain-containing sensor histidine kinase [Cronbergia sp. UHCC 0137]
MLRSASSDFVILCQEQIMLLTQGLGASLSVVYLTQDLVESPTGEAQLVPVVVYPESGALRLEDNVTETTVGNVLALPKRPGRFLTAGSGFFGGSTSQPEPNLQEDYLLSGKQIVLPLVYEGVMMGLLVTARDDRAWNEGEEGEIQRIAKTIAIACILDQRRAWLEQQLQQQRLLQAQQRDLLDNLLHQFRNPLTAIRTFGKLLLKRLRQAEPNRDVAVSIVRESDRLQELLLQFDQVIDLTEADLEPIPLPAGEVFVDTKSPLLLPGTGENVTNCCVADLLAPLLLSAQAIAQERNVKLIVDIIPDLPLVSANVKALREVLSNIIDNALKYTPAGGKVLIQVGQEKDRFQGIAISDTGPGIPPEDLPHLGERFYRGVQAQTSIPGTGLGIAIAKQLIAQMHGELEVFSPAISSIISSVISPGTTFIIWLPEVISEEYGFIEPQRSKDR